MKFFLERFKIKVLFKITLTLKIKFQILLADLVLRAVLLEAAPAVPLAGARPVLALGAEVGRLHALVITLQVV